MTETTTRKITPQIVAEHGLKPNEYERLLEILGREPSICELGIFSVMWSEHCSYKSSRVWLRTQPTTGKQVIQGPGENAGVVDLGDGGAVIFKMESHNHPSYLDTYQRAASCVGITTVGGETNFDKRYNNNILVNAMCAGLARTDKIFYSAAKGVGLPVIYVGSKTGRDGIHGATMASAEFDNKSDEKRPTVQVGDPFTEKLLIEACLELMAREAIVAIQDMGAA